MAPRPGRALAARLAPIGGEDPLPSPSSRLRSPPCADAVRPAHSSRPRVEPPAQRAEPATIPIVTAPPRGSVQHARSRSRAGAGRHWIAGFLAAQLREQAYLFKPICYVPPALRASIPRRDEDRDHDNRDHAGYAAKPASLQTKPFARAGARAEGSGACRRPCGHDEPATKPASRPLRYQPDPASEGLSARSAPAHARYPVASTRPVPSRPAQEWPAGPQARRGPEASRSGALRRWWTGWALAVT